MGGVPSTPRGNARPEEHADYLLGVLVGERPVDVHSQLWERLLNLPLTLRWPDAVINDACQSIVQNSAATGHFAKLLLHLAWSLQEVSCGHDNQSDFIKVTNAVRFSSVFVKYAIEHSTNDELTSCVSLFVNEKEATMTGLNKGNQNVANPVVLAVLSFIGTSDVNPSTYLLHLEVGNLFLLMLSTQLYSTTYRSTHIFIDAAMLQEPVLVGLVVRKLLLSYVARLPAPDDTSHDFNLSKPSQLGVLQRVGSAAAIVIRLPYYTYNYLVSSKSTAPTSPLAENSLLLLLALVHYRSAQQIEGASEKKLYFTGEDAKCLYQGSNPFCEALGLARDTEFVTDADKDKSAVPMLRIPFMALYDTIGSCLTDGRSILVLYSLLHGNSAFMEYVLVRNDVDTLLMPLLQMLYDSPRKSLKQIYMMVIILLILSQDTAFNSMVHKLMLPGVSWFQERLLNQTTLGSLMVVILIRTVKYSLAKLRDVYLLTNCLAALSNMAPHAHRLNAYASQRILSLFDMLSRKYFKLGDLNGIARSSSLKVNDCETVEDKSTELHIYGDFLRIVLEIINSILTSALSDNPEVVYALLHGQELFQPLRNHPRFQEHVENIYKVISYFNTRLDAHSDEEKCSVEAVLHVIIANTRSWRGEGIKVFPQLLFTYEEEDCPEEFFVPYVWELVVMHSGITWDKSSITLFPPESGVEIGSLGEPNAGIFEMPSTPRVLEM